MARNYDDLQQSYGRCLRNRDFIARFYEIFLASHPAVPPMFAKTDFAQQRLALRRGISMGIAFAAGSDIVRRGIVEMAQAHARAGRTPVEPSLYAYWTDSLLKAVAENDAQADAKLLSRWREAMTIVTRHFAERY